MKRTRMLNTPWAAAALAVTALPLAISSAHAATTVWNVNVGSGIGTGQGFEITTTENYVGAAIENTINSTWNAVQVTTAVTLQDSTGSASAGVTFDLSANAGFGSQGATVGDEIFKTWIKDGDLDGGGPDLVNSDPWTATFGGLSPSTTYDVVVYSGWLFGPEAVPITLTAGTGLTGTFTLNSPAMGAGNPLATGLAQDTNAANTAGNFNYARFNGLMADGSGNITLSFGISSPFANDFAVNGFQLVTTIPEPSAALLGGLGLLGLLRRRR